MHHFAEQMDRARQEIVERCKLCGTCMKECRVRLFSKYADKDPVELQKARIDFLQGGELSQEVYDLAFSCMSCHYCRDACEEGLNPSRIGIICRTELVNRGQSAPAAYAFGLTGERFNYFSILSALLVNPSEKRWITELPESPEHADVVYFTGCGLQTMPDHLFTSLDILDRMDLNHVTLGGIAHCCGTPYLLAGRAADSGDCRERLVKSISAFTPETAVLFCSGCTASVSGSFADPSDLPFRPMHLSTFLGEHLDRLKFTNPIEKTVTVHDPCQLGRGLGEFEGVRKVLNAIPGVRLVEMEHSGKNTLCCGGPASQADPEAARKMARSLLEEAKTTGAEILVDLCLNCHRTFRSLSKGYPFEVVNFVTLAGRAMGIEHESKLPLYLQWRDVDRVVEDARANIEASAFSEEEVRFFLEMLFNFM